MDSGRDARAPSNLERCRAHDQARRESSRTLELLRLVERHGLLIAELEGIPWIATSDKYRVWWISQARETLERLREEIDRL